MVGIAQANLVPTRFQLIYEVFYCLWLLSFEDTVKEGNCGDLIRVVVAALRTIQKEKITRIALAVLRVTLFLSFSLQIVFSPLELVCFQEEP